MERQTGCGLLLLLVLAACGSGGPGPAADAEFVLSPQAVFHIRTEMLPAGTVGAAYEAEPLALDAEDADAAHWSVHQGTLPDGVALLPDGRLVGAPDDAGLWVFTVRAQMGPLVALKRLGLAVDALGVFAQEGVTAGCAWTGAPVRLRATGATGPVSFHADGPTGAIAGVDPQGGTATYVPGAVPGTETISVADATGRLATLSLVVTENPLAHRAAHFGSTDVWHIDVYRKAGEHPFATDFHDALATLGLRAPTSHTAVGTEADNLAAWWIRLLIHRRLNTYYLRDASGARGANGLAICFAWDHPTAPHTTPIPGGRSEGAAHRFSTMALVHAGGDPLAGRALVDNEFNTRHEHNAPPSHGPRLGVFVNAIAGSLRYLYVLSDLNGSPVDSDDVPTLEALIHGEPIPNSARARAIRDIGEALGQAIAKVTAHEVAHSLGLAHSEPSQSGSLMNTTIDIHPSAVLGFADADEQALRQVLPGPQRTTAQALHALLAGDAAAVCGCELRSGP